MAATARTVVGSAIVVLVAIGTSFRSLRSEMRNLHARIDAQGEDLRKRIDGQDKQLGLLRERMAHLEGLLEGLREAITSKRVAQGTAAPARLLGEIFATTEPEKPPLNQATTVSKPTRAAGGHHLEQIAGQSVAEREETLNLRLVSTARCCGRRRSAVPD